MCSRFRLAIDTLPEIYGIFLFQTDNSISEIIRVVYGAFAQTFSDFHMKKCGIPAAFPIYIDNFHNALTDLRSESPNHSFCSV